MGTLPLFEERRFVWPESVAILCKRVRPAQVSEVAKAFTHLSNSLDTVEVGDMPVRSLARCIHYVHSSVEPPLSTKCVAAAALEEARSNCVAPLFNRCFLHDLGSVDSESARFCS